MRKGIRRMMVMVLSCVMLFAMAVPAFAASNAESGYSIPATLTLQVGEQKKLTVKEPSGKYANAAFQSCPNYVSTSGFSGGSYWGKKAEITFTGKKAGSFTAYVTVREFTEKGNSKSFCGEHRLACKVTVKKVDGKTDSGKTDSGKTDSGKADSGKTDSGKTDTGKSDAGRQDSGSKTETEGKYVDASECYSIINTYRKQAGTGSMKRDAKIEELARIRAKELVTKYSHTRPNGEQGKTIVSWELCGKINGWMYRAENIACGQRTCAEVMNSWYNSPNHKKNMISANHTKVGIAGYEYKGEIYWVQLFAS